MGRVFGTGIGLAVGSAVLLASLPAAAAGRGPVPLMPIEEVRAGQTGIGLSVFQGTRPDTFEIEILGVLRDVGPGRDLILGKGRGEFLEKTGIIAGMSGSPIYVEGKLIGATAFAWSFSKEPVVGITPIGEMLEILDRSGESPGVGMEDPPPEGPGLALGEAAEPALASEVRPIQTPVVLTGLPAAARAAWQEFLSPLGFVGVEGGGSAPGDARYELSAGSAMGVQMVRGDFASTAIGTVTWTDGERVLGFGHPFLLAGPVSYPLCSVYIHTVLPSLVASFKIGAPGPAAGAIRQDRQAGVLGTLGTQVPMIPVTVKIVSGGDGPESEFHFEVIRSEILTSGLIGLVGYSSLEAAQKTVGESTLDIRTELRLAHGRVLDSRIAVASPSPPMALAEQIARPIQYLIANPFEPIRIEEVSVQVEMVDRFRVAAIEDLTAERTRVRPGEDLNVWVTLRPYRDSMETRRATIHVPDDAHEGTVDLIACGSGELWNLESERAPLRFEPTSLDQMIDLLGSRRDTRKCYLQIFEKKTGRVVEGREMPRLPGSILSVLNTGVHSGQAGPSEGAVVVEDEIGTPWVVVGSKTLKIEIVSR